MTVSKNYVQTNSGSKIYLDDLTDNQYNVRDIAHSLAMKARYNGHSDIFLSVAQHSWHLSNVVSDDKKLEALFHDAGEYVLPDFPRPIKAQFPELEAFEYKITEDIFNKLKLKWPLDQEIVDADDKMLATEARQIMSKSDINEWPCIGGLETYKIPIMSWRPEHAEAMFYDRFQFLWSKRVEQQDIELEEVNG